LDKPFLSIIIPAYNEENRLPDSINKVMDFIKEQPYHSEVLIVENGSSDRTLEVAKKFQVKFTNLIVVSESNRGKGLAVRRGMLEAKGKFRFMCDADLSMPISEIKRFLPPKLNDVEIAIASREAPGAVRYNEPEYRHLGGRGVNLMIRLFAIPDLHDTQCGFKIFRDRVADDLFRVQTLHNWSFDIELLFVAKMRGYRISEIPIPWHFNPETKLDPLKDAIQMGKDIWRIRRNARRGVYDRKV
jgi:glycosyltransferase involved in cell wall biosynthesis